MNLVIVLVAGINIGVALGAWWATGRIREPDESWPDGAVAKYVRSVPRP
jgi:hypothetical protein